MLRCKEGDKAVVIRGPFTGYIVTVGEYVGDTYAVTPEGAHMYTGDTWVISNEWILPEHQGFETIMRDASLQPIRGLRNWLLVKEKKT